LLANVSVFYCVDGYHRCCNDSNTCQPSVSVPHDVKRYLRHNSFQFFKQC
jgi:hypothetical protein